ncbi:MAG: hypothetical protein ACLUHE_14450 [Christensenellales bacterium]
MSKTFSAKTSTPSKKRRGISRLMNECALTQEAVAERLGRSRSAVSPTCCACSTCLARIR